MKRKARKRLRVRPETQPVSKPQSKATFGDRLSRIPWVRGILSVLGITLIPAVIAYWQIAEADLRSVGPPIVKTGPFEPATNSGRILTTLKERVSNRGWRSGHVDHVEIRPLKFDQPVEVETRYIDRSTIQPFQEKLLTFQFVQTVRHTGLSMFVVTVIDNMGKQVEEFQCGNQLWMDGEALPPKNEKPTQPD